MSEILTPERVMQVGETWKKMLLQSMTVEELDSYLPTYKQQILEQGLEQGIVSAKRETVRAMSARKFDIAIIADVTGLTVAQVNAILANDSAEEHPQT